MEKDSKNKGEKMKKRKLYVLATLCLSFIMVFSSFQLAFATNEVTLISKTSDSIVKKNDKELINTLNRFEGMSIPELNAYIDGVYRKYNSKTVLNGVVNPTTEILEIKAAWLAAAQIAKLKGYPCAAKAVEYSVLGINYEENANYDGLFRNNIVSTKAYKKCLKKLKDSGNLTIREVVTFTKSDNADLFFALHDATMTIGKYVSEYRTHVHDVFDFELQGYSGDIFVGAVNNWAWLCQNKHVLNPVEIDVYFKE